MKTQVKSENLESAVREKVEIICSILKLKPNLQEFFKKWENGKNEIEEGIDIASENADSVYSRLYIKSHSNPKCLDIYFYIGFHESAIKKFEEEKINFYQSCADGKHWDGHCGHYYQLHLTD